MLGGLSAFDLNRRNNRGIFTIFQLSHTFSAKRLKTAINKKEFYIELKAIAIREQKTYVLEIPTIRKIHQEIFLDFESLPEENYVYLIGIIIKIGMKKIYKSFWANSAEQEENIFKSFFKLIEEYPKCKIYHYGNYETKQLNRFNKLHKEKYTTEIDKIIKKTVNIFSFFISTVYPPVFSNSLKEICNFIGFKWSKEKANGILSIAWRKKWEIEEKSASKSKLIQYNIDDCDALIIAVNLFISVLNLSTFSSISSILKSLRALVSFIL